MSVKICSLKAFNDKFKNKIFAKKVLLGGSDDENEEEIYQRAKTDYDLKEISIEEIEQMEICESHHEDKKDKTLPRSRLSARE